MTDESYNNDINEDQMDPTNNLDRVNEQSLNGAQEEACHPNDSNDPFANLESLRLSQDFSGMANVKTVLTSIAVRKPNRHEFVRVRAGDGWKFSTATFTDKELRETYLVSPNIREQLAGEVTPTALFLTISRNSPMPFLWPIPLPGPDGRTNRWYESAFEAAKLAEQSWLRVAADMSAGCYIPQVAQGELPDPVWPEDLALESYLRLAFKDRMISDFQHPMLRRLRGEI